MKKYFDFTLTGSKFLVVWLPFLVVFLALYVSTQLHMRDYDKQSFVDGALIPMAYSLVMLILVLVYRYFVVHYSLNHTWLGGEPLRFQGSLGRFLWIVFSGLVLIILTVGLWLPIFTRNIWRFFVRETSFREEGFLFLGKAWNLAGYLILGLFLPICLLMVLMVTWVGVDAQSVLHPKMIVLHAAFILALTPYMYWIYKWMVNFRYKGYVIRWDTQFIPAVGVVLRETFFSVITLGIYYPMAFLKLYQYFLGKTFAYEHYAPRKSFGFDLDAGSDFLFLWGQFLLVLITLGIYSPWAFCKIGRRIMRKTYMQEV